MRTVCGLDIHKDSVFLMNKAKKVKGNLELAHVKSSRYL